MLKTGVCELKPAGSIHEELLCMRPAYVHVMFVCLHVNKNLYEHFYPCSSTPTFTVGIWGLGVEGRP